MNIYDFDRTLFFSDTTDEFAKFCFKYQPFLLTIYFIKMFYVHKIKREKDFYKESIAQFSYLTKIKNFDIRINDFWNKNYKRLPKIYLNKYKRDDDFILSGSPSCLLEPLMNRLNVKFKATEYDRKKGVITGNLMLCRNKAKFIIENEMFPIDEFYSDSISDTPVALLAEHPYLVNYKTGEIKPWPHISEFFKNQ